MHPSVHAKTQPDKPAFIMAGSGETVTYRQLEERSNQGAQLFRKLGLKTGDGIAIFMENNVYYLPVCWAAQRSGLYFTCISSRLTAGEIEERVFVWVPHRFLSNLNCCPVNRAASACAGVPPGCAT